MSPEDQVPVTMTASQWNAVLVMLAEQPYRQAAQLIQTIQQQVQQFAQQDDRGRAPVAWKAAE